MALSPDININLQRKTYDDTRSTYKIDFNSNRIIGKSNRIDALKQFIRKSWITKRNEFLIYNNQFGIDNDRLFGDFTEEFIKMEGQRVLIEAISYDPRIISINNFNFNFRNDEVHINCEIETIFGIIQITEVI